MVRTIMASKRKVGSAGKEPNRARTLITMEEKLKMISKYEAGMTLSAIRPQRLRSHVTPTSDPVCWFMTVYLVSTHNISYYYFTEQYRYIFNICIKYYVLLGRFLSTQK